MEYNGGSIAAKYFLQMNFEKDSKILDIGAGTGIIGEILQHNGYENIDALDSNEEMLTILKQKNCYKNVIKSIVTPETKLPINDRQYDIIIMAGVFCPGHIDYRSLAQIIRITKSGIFVLFCFVLFLFLFLLCFSSIISILKYMDLNQQTTKYTSL